MSPFEHSTVLARLASLLLEAAGVAAGKCDDNEHRPAARCGAEAQGGSRYSAVHRGAGPEQSRESATPIRARDVARQRGFRAIETQHRADFSGTKPRNQPFEAGPCHQAAGGTAEILVDDFDGSRLARNSPSYTKQINQLLKSTPCRRIPGGDERLRLFARWPRPWRFLR